MHVANLPARRNESSPEPSKLEEAIIDRLEAGETPPKIATRLAKGDKALAKRLRRKIWRMVRHDAQFQRNIAERAQAHLLAGLPAAAAGVSRRAGRGRTDAAKLAFEASGFHNPRVQHEHSGDVNITVSIPRPAFDTDGAVTDAEVVEDT